MKIFKINYKSSFNKSNINLAIGNFDGVHIGHQEVIKKLVAQSNLVNTKSAILSFNPHPRQYFENNYNDFSIIDEEKKIKIFEQLNVDYYISLKFDSSLASLSAEKFIKDILVKKLNVVNITVGYDFKFGKNRSGDVDNIISYFGKDNVILLSDYIIDNEKVSSTKIRNFLDTGNIQKANNFLGREYELSGLVVKGKKLGSKIGFPTANLQLNNDLYLPKFGVYEISCIVNGNLFKGILNIGITPTVLNSKKVKIEAHLFNFNENIYDKNIVIQLKKFIREEIKFNSIDDLIKQINIDISSVKKK